MYKFVQEHFGECRCCGRARASWDSFQFVCERIATAVKHREPTCSVLAFKHSTARGVGRETRQQLITCQCVQDARTDIQRAKVLRPSDSIRAPVIAWTIIEVTMNGQHAITNESGLSAPHSILCHIHCPRK